MDDEIKYEISRVFSTIFMMKGNINYLGKIILIMTICCIKYNQRYKLFTQVLLLLSIDMTFEFLNEFSKKYVYAIKYANKNK